MCIAMCIALALRFRFQMAHSRHRQHAAMAANGQAMLSRAPVVGPTFHGQEISHGGLRPESSVCCEYHLQDLRQEEPNLQLSLLLLTPNRAGRQEILPLVRWRYTKLL